MWSDEDLMDQPTIHTIYEELDTICVDPTDLIFLNTFRMLLCFIHWALYLISQILYVFFS